MRGTAYYCSINTHFGVEQSRRDDLEMIAYTVIFFAKGTKLPWFVPISQDEIDREHKYDKVKEIKVSTTSKELCKGLPLEFLIFLEYVKRLDFAEEPDYDYLAYLFKSCRN